ncbi:MAG: TIGR00645 family protein, partial [Pseudomonadota bacterium]
MERFIEKSLFASRWLLAPMYLGLVVTVALLVWVFAVELVRFVTGVASMTVDDAILGVLALIDLSLAANLLMIVIFSGYENFVSRMDLEDHEDRPAWQGEVDFSALKLKLVASIVAISGIHLLKVFMDVTKYESEQIRWLVIIHLVFVVSGVLLAAMDWIAS